MGLEAVADILADAIGLNPASLGEKTLLRAARSEMARLGLSPAAARDANGAGSADPGDAAALEAYARLLRRDKEALDGLIREVVVPETWFFRDGEAFACLAARASDLKRQGRPLRILSAPCATGEEVYSIAMTCLGAGYGAGECSVLGADVSADSLEAARKALYGPNSFRAGLGAYGRYFASRGANGASGELRAVTEEALRCARFVRANIISADFLAGEPPFDVIFSRNLLIYLTDPARRLLTDNIRRLLAPDGLLFAGHAEAAYFLSRGFTADPHPRAFACRLEASGASASLRAARIPPKSPPKARSPVTTALAAKGPPPARYAPEKAVSPGFGPRFAASTPANGTARGNGSPAPVFAPTFAPTPGVASGVTSGVTSGLTSAAASPSAKASAPPSFPPSSPVGEDLLAEARMLADRGELSSAARLCARRLELSPQCAEAYALLGLIALAGGDADEAVRNFQKALYLDPGQRDSLAHLSALLETRGEKDRAANLRRRFERLEQGGYGG